MSHSKVQADHLRRNAYLYVRQSTLRQVFENTESTKRQYELRRRALALGWTEEQIVTIDSDLGQSGAGCSQRQGFQHLVAEVGLGNAGIVMGLEVSRLSRNSSDWHKLLELCAHSCTLILDEDGIYDPTDFNDRLLLGLKGTMSEAELHVLRSRLRGGILNKARRGELRKKIPVGFIYDDRGALVLDPDRQVREAVDLLFKTFFRLNTATAVVRYVRDHNIKFPRRNNGGPHHGDIVWGRLGLNQAVNILHNPCYAGCYAFGRFRYRKGPDGKIKVIRKPREQWLACIPDAHQGYINWEQFQQNERTLAQTAQAYGQDRRHGPPREGPALLQGIVLCGVCGTKMTVRYHRRPEGLFPDYFCCNRGPTGADAPCQIISGRSVDEAIGRVVVEAVKSEALEITLAVQDELHRRCAELCRHRKQSVERAQYEADHARQRYMKVDPNHRLVADTLEAEWNEKLRLLEQAQLAYQEGQKADELRISEQAQKQIRDLATELPALWNDGRTSAKDRKRMLRLIVEDVTLCKTDYLTVGIRFRGGSTRTMQLDLPLNAWQKRKTPPELVQQIDELLNEHYESAVVTILNHEGKLSGANQTLMIRHLRWVKYHYKLTSHKERLKQRGYVTRQDLSKHLGIHRATITLWREKGYLEGRICNELGEWMYKIPDPNSLPDYYRQKKMVIIENKSAERTV